METALKTDIGRIRSVNEDRVLVDNHLNGFTLAVIADGMGGHKAGDVASQMAVEVIHTQLLSLHASMTAEECMIRIKSAVSHANEAVYSSSTHIEQYRGMGTTVVLVLATDELFILAHIGDSRIYKWDGEEIEQLTMDHSLVNELLKSGQISAEEAIQHPRRNVLLRALGTEQRIEVDIEQLLWKPGDMLLLCSDGLSGFVNRSEMADILRTTNDLDWKASRLVDRALETGGDDNITVILLANNRSSLVEEDNQ